MVMEKNELNALISTLAAQEEPDPERIDELCALDRREVLKVLITDFGGLGSKKQKVALQYIDSLRDEAQLEWFIRAFWTDRSLVLEHIVEHGSELAVELLQNAPCPVCGAPMVEKKSRYGRFLGCSKFPKCRGKRKLP